MPPLQADGAHWLSGKFPSSSRQPRLLFVFTRDCGNCHRSHAFLNRMHEKYGNRIQIVGIHSPEFAWEKDIAKLRRYASEQKIQYPVYLDSDMKIWNALDNRYWPAFHIFDASGRKTHIFAGETHNDDNQARQIEAALRSIIP